MADVPDALVDQALSVYDGILWDTFKDAAPDLARAVLAAVADDLSRVAPAVDREAACQVVHKALQESQYLNDEDAAVDALLASGVLADAARVRADARRDVAEEIARRIETSEHAIRVNPQADIAFDLAAEDAREVGRRDE